MIHRYSDLPNFTYETKLRHREVRWFVQAYTGGRWLLQDSTPGSVIPRLMLLTNKLYHFLMQTSDLNMTIQESTGTIEVQYSPLQPSSGSQRSLPGGADLGSDVVHLINLIMTYDIINSTGDNLIELYVTRHKTPSESQKHKTEEAKL